MDKKTGGLIATIGTTLVCGLPGLCLCLFGGTFAFAGAIPGSDIDIGGSSDPQTAIATGVSFLCVSVFLIATPVAVGFFTLRNKPEDGVLDAVPAVPDAPFSDDEPIPPTS